MSTQTHRQNINKTADMTKMALMVAMNCISAYIIIPLPFSMSPIALQTLIVNLTGYLLTAKQAFITMLVYLLIGLAGVPVFTGGSGGPGKRSLIILLRATAWAQAAILRG